MRLTDFVLEILFSASLIILIIDGRLDPVQFLAMVESVPFVSSAWCNSVVQGMLHGGSSSDAKPSQQDMPCTTRACWMDGHWQNKMYGIQPSILSITLQEGVCKTS